VEGDVDGVFVSVAKFEECIGIFEQYIGVDDILFLNLHIPR
jgi:hypothetical protein